MTLFEEVYSDLDNKIKNGLYNSGEVLPSELELQNIYEVSRTTIRKAVDKLVIEGKVVRKKGIGLFVKPKITKQNIFDMTGIIKPAYLNANEKIKIKDNYVRKAGEYYSVIFNIDVDELIHFVSFITISDTSQIYEELLIPVDNFPGFNPDMLKVTSIIETINTGNSKIRDVYQDFQLTETSEEVARELKNKEGNPVFEITNTFLDEEEHVIALEYKIQDALNTKYTIDFD